MRDLKRPLACALLGWLGVTLAWAFWPAEHGLRAQYFANADWVAPPALVRVDPVVSTGVVYHAWRAAPPDHFSVQWSGFVDVPSGAPRTFTLEADDSVRWYVDDQLVVDANRHESMATGGAILEPGTHRVVVHYAQRGEAYAIDWYWSDADQARKPVPSWALTPRQPGATARMTRWLEPIWLTVTAIVGLLLSAFGTQRAGVWSSPRSGAIFAARLAILLPLAWLFITGATEHAQVVNTFKARGDQSGYLWDAQVIYANWNGRSPQMLVGERMRMPVYAAYLALGYSPRMTDDELFEMAKTWNIRLAVALMAGLAILFAWHLPPLLSLNLTIIVAFGYWAFKAGYSQPELLFYFFFFATFLACMHMFKPHRPLVDLGLGVLAGACAGLTFLTKALVPPFIALFLAAYAGREIYQAWAAWRSADVEVRRYAGRRFTWRALAGIAMAVTFVAVVWPYISNSKRVFGQYFYNANTTYFMWYDDGGEARAVMLPHMDIEGRVSMPPETLPSLGQYLRTRSMGQIASRLTDGLQNIVVRSYETYWYFYFALAYLGLAAAVVAANWRAFASLVATHLALMLFLIAYAAVYLLGTAFFSITSSTGTTRFFITHLTPLLFALSYLFSMEPFRNTTWRLGGAIIRVRHAHVAILCALGIGLAFFWWPRLMTTYGGF